MRKQSNGLAFSMVLAALFGIFFNDDLSAQERLITGMQCEHLENHIGLDTDKPRFSWVLPEGTVSQTGYEIIVGTDSSSVMNGEGNVWNSGLVKSNKVLAEYAGTALMP